MTNPREAAIGRRVAVIVDGELTIHAAPAWGNDYDTLCGLDANDKAVGHEPAAGRKRWRIDCEVCWSIWTQARLYDRKDFVAKLTGEPA